MAASPIDRQRRAELCRRLTRNRHDTEAAQQLADLYQEAGWVTFAGTIRTGSQADPGSGAWKSVLEHARTVLKNNPGEEP